MKTRLFSIAMAMIFCVAAVGVWWRVQHPGVPIPQANPSPPQFSNVPSDSSQTLAPNQPMPELLTAAPYSRDDRSDEERAYQSKLSGEVNHLVTEAADHSADALADDEQALPIDALPLLASAIDKPDVPAKSAAMLHAALNADSVRLKVGMARQQTRQWYQATATDIFKKSLSPPPSWTYPGTLAVDAAVRLWSGDSLANPDDNLIVWRTSWSINQTPCQEPLLLYIYAQSLAQFESHDTVDIASAFRRAMGKMNAGPYPPIRKLLATLRYLQYKAIVDPNAAPVTGEEAQLPDQCRALFTQVAADAQIPRRQWLDLFDIAGQTALSLNKDRNSAMMNFFWDTAEKSALDRSTLLTAKGRFYIDYAWDARPSASSSTTTQPQDSPFAQRLANAATNLEEAWRLDPANADAATAMIDVELGQGQGPDRMNLWFGRATDVDPDHFEAYSAKLRYLEPRWHGSIQQMIDFGHECASGGNWDAGIPLILVDAYLAAAHYTDGQWHAGVDPSYFHSNQAAWNDIQSVYAQFFSRHPRNNYEHLRYAQLACWCEQWARAQQAFDEVGDQFDPRVFSTRDELQKAKTLVASHQSQIQPTN